MADIRFTELPDASAVTGSELQPLSQLSTTTTLTATTISASSVGNVLADSGNGFVTAGFAANQQVRISGFTGGGVANNLTATIVSVSAGLLYVDVALTSAAAGDTVTITRWLSRKATPATVQAGAINTATGKTTPADADALGLVDSAASNVLKKLTWVNIKATLKTYTDTLYALTGAITGSGLTMATGMLLGRSTASTGAIEEITVGSGLSLSAGTLSATSSGITALTGDVTASGSGSVAATIANDAVTYAKIQNVSATSRVLLRKTAGAGDVEEGTLSELLDFVGSAAQGDILYRNGSAWVRLGAGTAGYVLKTGGAGANPSWAANTQSIIIACSDETTALTTGTEKVTFRMPYAFTLSGVRASVTTAPTGSTLTVDIKESGATILSTKITIDASAKTSTTAATPAVISDTALADDAEITINIDQVGSTVAGAGLKVVLIGYRP